MTIDEMQASLIRVTEILLEIQKRVFSAKNSAEHALLAIERFKKSRDDDDMEVVNEMLNSIVRDLI